MESEHQEIRGAMGLQFAREIQQRDPSRLNAVALKKIERVFGKLPVTSAVAPQSTPRLRALQ